MIPHVKLTWAVLFIQMKLCQKTLRNFLDERNEHSSFAEYYQQFPSLHLSNDLSSAISHKMITYSMFQQLCNGLEYIHAKGIVHHDIKPPNVFLSREESGGLTLQLGDFGLACPLEDNMVRHNGFGTRLYASPEQLAGTCTKKSDIYSLGVILIELLCKCITVMECFKKVEKMKKDGEVSDIEPESCELIKLLLSDQNIRPDINELRAIIQRKLESSSNEVDCLKKVIKFKDDVIHQKNQQIDDLKDEIIKLRKQLSINEVEAADEDAKPENPNSS